MYQILLGTYSSFSYNLYICSRVDETSAVRDPDTSKVGKRYIRRQDLWDRKGCGFCYVLWTLSPSLCPNGAQKACRLDWLAFVICVNFNVPRSASIARL